jgi:hypothetical protein
VGTALANPDGDPWPNWQEYAFGLDPRVPDEALFQGAVVSEGGVDYLGAISRLRSRAVDLRWELQASQDGETWEIVSQAEVVDAVDHGDGTETLTVREQAPVGASPARLLRMGLHFEP